MTIKKSFTIMNQEQLTVGGFVLIMIVIGAGVVYNWGFTSGLDQASVITSTSVSVSSDLMPPPPPPPLPSFPTDESIATTTSAKKK